SRQPRERTRRPLTSRPRRVSGQRRSTASTPVCPATHIPKPLAGRSDTPVVVAFAGEPGRADELRIAGNRRWPAPRLPGSANDRDDGWDRRRGAERRQGRAERAAAARRQSVGNQQADAEAERHAGAEDEPERPRIEQYAT